MTKLVFRLSMMQSGQFEKSHWTVEWYPYRMLVGTETDPH